MQKYEYDDTYKVLYRSTRKTPFFVNVPPMHYITYNGKGHPSGPDFQEACNSLFSLSYTLKFKVARPKGFDYKVNPMEVSWFLDKKDGTIDFTWKAMIMQPACISHTDFCRALEISRKLGKDISYEKLQFEEIDFGRCVQCFHPGDYIAMNATMYRMQDFARENGLAFDPYTHDIYLNDSRKTKTENLKAIMRIGVHKK